MSNEKVFGGHQFEQSVDVSIPEDTLASGRGYGLSDEAIAGIHLLDPAYLRRDHSGYDEKTRVLISERLAEAGLLFYEADMQTREAMVRSWHLSHSALAMKTVAYLMAQPKLREATSNPRTVAELAHGTTMCGKGRGLDLNLRLVDVCLEKGVIAALEADKPGRATDIFGFTRRAYKTGNVKEERQRELDRYCQSREQMIELICTPGFDRFAQSRFGPLLMRGYVLDAESKDGTAMHASTKGFLDLIADPDTFANLEAIAQNNPSLIQALGPDKAGKMSASEYQRFCAAFATIAPEAIHDRLLGISFGLEPEERLRFIQLCTQTKLGHWLTKTDTRLGFNEEMQRWVVQTGADPETLPQLNNKALLLGLIRATSGPGVGLFLEAKRSSRHPFAALCRAVYDKDEGERVSSSVDWAVIGKEAIRLFTDFYTEFGIDYTELWERWHQVGNTPEECADNIRDVIAAMRSLETAEPGICHALYRHFQIRQFNRYPREQLLQQYREHREVQRKGSTRTFRQEEADHAFVLYGSADGNRGLHNNGIYRLPTMLRCLKGSQIVARIFEAASPREALIAAARSRRWYGSAAVGYYAIHGSEMGLMTFGTGKNEVLSPEDVVQQTPGGYTLHAKNANGLEQVFKPGAPVVGNSCFGGLEVMRPGMGRSIAAATGTTVHTSSVASTVVDIAVQRVDGHLEVVPTFVDRDDRILAYKTYDGHGIRNEATEDPFNFEWPSSRDRIAEFIRQISKNFR